ncbi:Small auxin-up RNA [Dillenia turbinata]|uniref:Small auxin-up RNA n=1 Tax=Dillenia turbinata TaxID=194707 RepID=A0AAN8ZVB1_9MAGN
MARKWQKRAATGRKRISLPRRDGKTNVDDCSTSSEACKGHFVVYTTDQRRFMIPLTYLNNFIFAALLMMSEEEFGLPCDGPITLPCKAAFLEYILLIIQRGISTDLTNALISSMASSCCSMLSDLHQDQNCSRLLVSVY